VLGGAFSSMNHQETAKAISAFIGGSDISENNGEGSMGEMNEKPDGGDNHNASSSDSSDDEASIDMKDVEDRVKALDIVALHPDLKKFHNDIYLLMEKSVAAKSDFWEPIR